MELKWEPKSIENRKSDGKKGMPKTMLKFEAEKIRNRTRINRPWSTRGSIFGGAGGGGRLETSFAGVMPHNLTRSPLRRGAADFFLVQNATLGAQGSIDSAIFVDFGKFQKSLILQVALGLDKSIKNRALDHAGSPD